MPTCQFEQSALATLPTGSRELSEAEYCKQGAGQGSAQSQQPLSQLHERWAQHNAGAVSSYDEQADAVAADDLGGMHHEIIHEQSGVHRALPSRGGTDRAALGAVQLPHHRARREALLRRYNVIVRGPQRHLRPHTELEVDTGWNKQTCCCQAGMLQKVMNHGHMMITRYQTQQVLNKISLLMGVAVVSA